MTSAALGPAGRDDNEWLLLVARYDGTGAWMVALPGDPLAPTAELSTLIEEYAAPAVQDSAASGAPLLGQCVGLHRFAAAPKYYWE